MDDSRYVKYFLLIFMIVFLAPKIGANHNLSKEDISIKIEEYYSQTFGTYDLPEITVSAPLTYDKETELIARLLMSECANEPFEGQVAVVNVLFNRAKRKGWTINQVIMQRDKRGNPQFDGIDTKRFHDTPTKQTIKAAKLGRIKKVVPDEVEFFHNPVISTDTKWVNYIEKWTFKDIGRHRFCYNPNRIDKKAFNEKKGIYSMVSR